MTIKVKSCKHMQNNNLKTLYGNVASVEEKGFL